MKSLGEKEVHNYFFGKKSKFANWTLNHPFQIAGICTLIALIIVINLKDNIISNLIINLCFYFGMAIFFRIFFRNLCYLVEIDTKSEKITFFRCFNMGVVEAPIQSVDFIFDIHFSAIYAGERFTIFNEYLPEIEQLLPSGKNVNFSQNFYSRFMEKQLKKKRHR